MPEQTSETQYETWYKASSYHNWPEAETTVTRHDTFNIWRDGCRCSRDNYYPTLQEALAVIRARMQRELARAKTATKRINTALDAFEARVRKECPDAWPLRLTKPELSHLYSLIQTNEREGEYYGPKEQYWKRSDRIKAKIKGANDA